MSDAHDTCVKVHTYYYITLMLQYHPEQEQIHVLSSLESSGRLT